MQSYVSNYNKYTQYLLQNSENIIAFEDCSEKVILINENTRINENLSDSNNTPKFNDKVSEEDIISSLSTELEDDVAETPHFGGYSYE
jgi:hypothetical protein